MSRKKFRKLGAIVLCFLLLSSFISLTGIKTLAAGTVLGTGDVSHLTGGQVAAGGTTVTLPAGFAASDVTITISAGATDPVSPYVGVSTFPADKSVREISMGNIPLEKVGTISFSYDGLGAADQTKLAVFKKVSDTNWAKIGGTVDAVNHLLTAPFSGEGVYAIMEDTLAFSTTRLAGSDRFATAVAISQAGWPNGANTVVLARADNFPDALSGAPLAYKLNAPILITDPDSLTPATETEIDRLKATNVVILGGYGAVSKVVEDRLANTKHLQVNRIGGSDRFQTAALIAKELGYKGTAVIAYGQDFPDGLAISSYAANQGYPILLTETNELPGSTSQALTDLSVDKTIVVGGPGVVGDSVYNQLKNPQRYSGSNRYATAMDIVNRLGCNLTNVYLTTGENFPDALAGSALAARTDAAIVLVSNDFMPDSVANFFNLNGAQVKRFIALGGSGVVSPSVVDQLTSTLATGTALTWNSGAEPNTLDPQFNAELSARTLDQALFEGLTRLDKSNFAQPAAAKSWDISADGLTYTFHLRDNKWSNGDPVTAEDFKFAWTRLLNPVNAAEYCYLLYPIKNAPAFNQGKASAADLGITAVDAKTLRVTLEAPYPQLLSVLSDPVAVPVNQNVVQANASWASSPATLVGNGPFKVREWNHLDHISLEKNMAYWDAANVGLLDLTFKFNADPLASFNAFKAGQLDGTNNISQAQFSDLKASGNLVTTPYGGTYFYRFNTKVAPFDNPKVRRALSLAIDRKALIDTVIKGNQTSAKAYVPFGTATDQSGVDFRQQGGDLFAEDLAQARQLLADANYPGGQNFPAVTILYNTSFMHANVAQAIQTMWKNNLGIDVTMRPEEWKVYNDDMQKGNYAIARAGWIADYADPYATLELFTSTSSNNMTGWSNSQYDSLIAAAQNLADPAQRNKDLHDAEQILMNDMPIMPIYFYTNNYAVQPYVKNVYVSSLGIFEFKNAAITK